MSVKNSILVITSLMFIAASGLSAETLRIGITQNNVGVDSYQTAYEQAFVAAAEEIPNLEVRVLDAAGDVARQMSQIRDLVQQRMDAIIIWPTSGEALLPVVRQAHSSGVPIVVTNSPLGGAGRDYISSFSGPDNVTQGIYAAEMMCEALDGEGMIVQISGQPGYTTAIERAQGFEERLADICPGVTLRETQSGSWNRDRAQGVMEYFLAKYRRIDGVYSGDDNMGVGALNAALAANRADEIVFVGATNFAVGYEAMEQGLYYGSVYQSPVQDARNALQTAIAVARGEDVPFLNYFETPKITVYNLMDFEKPVF